MSARNYKDLKMHKGHNIECVTYGENEVNVAVECKDCHEVIIDYDKKNEKYITGWVLSNNEKGDIVIQKDDESKRFKSDDEATKFVVSSYYKLLEACKESEKYLVNFVNWETGINGTHLMDSLQQAISEAEKKD